jgi:hypothetical protein
MAFIFTLDRLEAEGIGGAEQIRPQNILGLGTYVDHTVLTMMLGLMT